VVVVVVVLVVVANGVVVAMVVAVVVDVVASADCVVDDDTGTSVFEEAISAVSLTPPQAAATRLIVSMDKGTPFRRIPP
jgi:hypothetical protein